MEDPIEKLNAGFLKQDVNFIKEQHKQLMRSYISLTADFVVLQGLILDIASQTRVNTDEILDTFEKTKTKKRKELLAVIKKSKPDFYGDL